MATRDGGVKERLEEVYAVTRARNGHEPEFLQAVHEVLVSLEPALEAEKKYLVPGLLERLVEPERQIAFRVIWEDDMGNARVNRGFRIQHNQAIGPYKGGLRFHPTVNMGILKFLAFEQTFKNSLTGLAMGGAKGGADFDPKGKSDSEVMRFCQAFMTELCRYVGADRDVPAGDIGVGAREIGYLFGQYRRMSGEFTGVLTGKGLNWGGSLIRPEATGYGCVYFAQEMLAERGDGFKGKTCLISGAGNVSFFTAEKLLALGAKPITLSDSNGAIVDQDGFDAEKLDFVRDLKFVRRGRISEYVAKYPRARYLDGQKPWGVPAQCAFPCATQNEIDANDAKTLLDNGVALVCEGANMPATEEAANAFVAAKIAYAPGKASNAGGVAVSGLEMSQNSQRLSWTREEVDQRLMGIMKNIHRRCVQAQTRYGQPGNYVMGANIAGFTKVADAMLDQGLV